MLLATRARAMQWREVDPRTTKLHSQKDVGECLAKYGVRLSPEIEVKFCPEGTDFTLPPPNGDIYMHPRVWRWG